jgi:hypothetical protein
VLVLAVFLPIPLNCVEEFVDFRARFFAPASSRQYLPVTFHMQARDVSGELALAGILQVKRRKAKLFCPKPANQLLRSSAKVALIGASVDDSFMFFRQKVSDWKFRTHTN